MSGHEYPYGHLELYNRGYNKRRLMFPSPSVRSCVHHLTALLRLSIAPGGVSNPQPVIAQSLQGYPRMVAQPRERHMQ